MTTISGNEVIHNNQKVCDLWMLDKINAKYGWTDKETLEKTEELAQKILSTYKYAFDLLFSFPNFVKVLEAIENTKIEDISLKNIKGAKEEKYGTICILTDIQTDRILKLLNGEK
ncbi:MAG: hypothetical protein AMQ74_01679 [Candidatus Methanofastidiosum methylothiophilum]|uniref:Uncharacterized protein n=1 Tax=Candidatus Methanofastidiosum methylothiophilum TaxID=1705564 RepID=A0A150IQW0_9EURY|nr:MAG: hypothetical protein AMQ74_01679 [Candidatus Methanofastidiosum methylthiophilus]